MLDHIHLIIEIILVAEIYNDGREIINDGNSKDDDVGATTEGCPGQTRRSVLTLSNVVARFKSLTTRRYIDSVNQSNWPRFVKHLWHCNYYAHIIRNNGDYWRIVEYIQANPVNWDK